MSTQPTTRSPKGDVIYAPQGQAGEYAALALNLYTSCGMSCAYCWVPQVVKMDRKLFNAPAAPRTDIVQRLLKDAKAYRGAKDQVMLSFTSDPYHPGDTSLTREALVILRDHDLAFCTLSKGGTRALRDLDLFRPSRDAYAASLTSLDEQVSLKWEPHAPLPSDRIAALQAFKKAGIFTWVSLEPTLDTATSLRIVRETHTFVDLYKIGRANYLPMTKTTNWERYTLEMVELCQSLGARHYVKKDLQPYLPQGYDNPIRLAQHH